MNSERAVVHGAAMLLLVLVLFPVDAAIVVPRRRRHF